MTWIGRSRSQLRTGSRLVVIATVMWGAAVSSPSAQVDRKRAEVWFQEAEELCQREGGRTWGISLCGPIVIADAASGTIATNRKAPEATKPALLGYANAVAEWGGERWSTLVWQTIPADARVRGRLVMHELFHRIQPQLAARGTSADC